MSERPTLAQLQHWMRWIISDPRGVAPALADPRPTADVLKGRVPEILLSTFQEPSPSCLTAISEQPPLSREDRLSIYAHAYFQRLVDVVTSDFPTMAKVLGEEDFRELVADYLVQHPSTTPNAAEVAGHLPGFVKAHRFCHRYPFLADLARLEWSLVEAFHADELPAFDATLLSSIGEEAWEHVTFKLDRALNLLELEWPVEQLWYAETAAPPDFAPSRTYLAIFRAEGQARVRKLEKLPFLLLTQMQSGKSLGAVCEDTHKALNLEADSVAVSTVFGEWFGNWITEGWIRNVRLAN